MIRFLFFDPAGNVDVLYVDTSGHVILLSPNDPPTPQSSRLDVRQAWRPIVTTDLSALTGVTASSGLPSVDVVGSSATVAYRTASDTVEVLTLTWSSGLAVPIYTQNAFNEKNPLAGSTSTTTGNHDHHAVQHHHEFEYGRQPSRPGP